LDEPTTPWPPADSPEEEARRREAYQRLLEAAHRVGVPLENLHRMLANLARSETETRRFLAEEVYRVPDELLDDMVRVRLQDLEEGRGDAPRGGGE
jgi:hypothetical protein